MRGETNRSTRARSANSRQLDGSLSVTVVRPRRYKVGYTWSRGGRLKELRIRHLARKFLYLWIRRTFGRVCPSRAYRHHRLFILRRALNGWKEEWWMSRKEWTLTLRAECHYKYRLCSQALCAWLVYSCQRRERKKQLVIAVRQGERWQLRVAWQRWHLYLDVCRIKCVMRETAAQHKERAAVRYVWVQWKKQLELRQEQLSREGWALRHWAYWQERRVWLQWKGEYQKACSLKHALAGAALYHRRHLQSKAFHLWIVYLHCRRARVVKKGEVQHMRYHTLVRQHWQVWRDALHSRLYEKDRALDVAVLAEQNRQHRVVSHWPLCVQRCQRADEFYKKYLKRVGFHMLALNVVKNKTHRVHKVLATQQHQHYVVLLFWKRWQERLEAVEERRLCKQADAVQTRYRTQLLKFFLQNWRENLQEHRKTQELHGRADRCLTRRLKAHCLHAWREFVADKKQYRQNAETAQQQCRHWMYNWAFYTWWNRMVQAREQRLAERMAVLHANRSSLERLWLCWRDRAHKQQRYREKQEVAETHQMRTLAHRTLVKWRRNAALIRAEKEKQDQAIRHLREQSIHKALTIWRRYVQHRRTRASQREQVTSYHTKKLLLHMLGGWKESQHQVQQACRKADELHRERQEHLLRQAVLAWREVTSDVRRSREQKSETVRLAQAQLQKVRLQQVFGRWRQHSKEVAQENWDKEASWKLYSTTLLSRCLRSWRQLSLTRQRVRLMQTQASCLLLRRTFQRCFSQWEAQLLLRRKEAELTEVALWHWSLTLQGKVLDAWKCWFAEQRRKQIRLAQATEFYRDQLLREGVTRVLTNTADTSLALQSHEQSSRRVQSIVRQCASRWKQQALCEPHRPSSNQKKSVSFSVPGSGDGPGSGSKFGSTCWSSHTPDCSIHGVYLEAEDNDHLPLSAPRLQPRRPEYLLTLNPEHELRIAQSSASVQGYPTESSTLLPGKGAVNGVPMAKYTYASHLQEPSCSELLLPPSSFISENNSQSTAKQNSQVLLGPDSFTDGPSTEFQVGPANSETTHDIDVSSDDEEENILSGLHSSANPSATLRRELLNIRLELQRFQEDKRRLETWRRLADVLRSWLKTSATDGEEHERNTVELELQELETRMKRLEQKLVEEKPLMQLHATRIQTISSSVQEADGASCWKQLLS